MRTLFASLLAVAVVSNPWSYRVASVCRGDEQDEKYLAGVAQVDITPSYPVRLSGFADRRAESDGVTQPIWAKALAIAEPRGEPVVLITVDNLGVPAAVVNEVAARLAKGVGLKRERLAITATHTHTAPMLKGACPTLFGVPIPAEHQQRIDRYTTELTDQLEQVALSALHNQLPARLNWGVGSARFAINRRTKGGPVDHDLPVLVVRDPGGAVRAIYVNYACHCVTLSNNKISGDWAGYAQEAIQRAFPGATALVSIGCGADSNPNSGVTGDKADIAASQGAEIATELKRLMSGFLAPVRGSLTTSWNSIELPLAELPTRPQWEERAKRDDAIGYHARINLARLDRGESLRTKIDYPVQTWSFGDSLAMVFLPGEVVVDYALRLKRELDGRRLWINAYSNDAPCYIPSERVLREGGYEGGGAMVYYDVPAPLAPGLEDKIVGEARRPISERFSAPFDATRTHGSLPLSPQQSQAAIRVSDDLRVDLVAAEPLVVDPVAIDFGPDGKLWVCEMHDYPSGLPRPLGEGRGEGALGANSIGGSRVLDPPYTPGGRIRVLTDEDGDGHFDHSTIFLDNIPFPTGVTVWRRGVLVCAAPDILYAEDTNGDGRADVIKKVFSGFGTGNYQARVNSLCYGLDGWVYGSCGLFGGKIIAWPGHSVTGQSGSRSDPTTYELGDRDFRIKPDTGELEPATGRTQQGRVRDDWDNWFGCDNSDLCRHYPLADHYLRRNPYVTPPPISVHVPEGPNSNQLFLLTDPQRFKLSGPPGRVTAACGIGVYRDDLLFPRSAWEHKSGRSASAPGTATQSVAPARSHAERGNEKNPPAPDPQPPLHIFTCEPVNLLMHHRIVSPRGSTFTGRRADDEQDREFLASSDNWFRPVQAVTGPDGALWIVDMCRYVIEHPRWIPPEDLQQLDVRAGHTLGRIYRVLPRDAAPRPWPRLDKLDAAGLVAALDSPNGWQRDMASQMLVWQFGVGLGEVRGQRLEVRKDEHQPEASARSAAAAALESLVTTSRRAEARLHALCVLDGLDLLKPEVVARALDDPHPGVRRHAIRLAAQQVAKSTNANERRGLMDRLLNTDLPCEPQVQLQLAFALSECGAAAGPPLAKLALTHPADPFLIAAVLSSLNRDNVALVLSRRLELHRDPQAETVLAGTDRFFPPLLRSSVALLDESAFAPLFAEIMRAKEGRLEPWQLSASATILDVLPGRGWSVETLSAESRQAVRVAWALARQLVTDKQAVEATRIAALPLLGREPAEVEKDVALIGKLLAPRNSLALQSAAIVALVRLSDDRVATTLTAGWSSHTPALQAQIVDVLLSRDKWTRHLVECLEKQTIAAAQLDAARRQRLLTLWDEALRARAKRLLAGTTNPDRQKVLDEHRDVTTLAGDRQRGRAVFDKKCAACHRWQDGGHAVGPDLAALANKSPQYLLQEILDPNKNVDSRYVQYVAATTDGRIVVGLLASETATSITLRGQEGKEFPLLRSELDELQATSKSLMPEGLEKDVSKQDLADLIALLTGPGAPPKKLAGNSPAVVKPLNGRLALLAAVAEIFGGEIAFEAPLQNIGYWHGLQDHLVWTVQLDQPGEFDVYLDYACDNSSAGNTFVLEGPDVAVRGAVAGTGGWEKYVQKKIGAINLAAGTHRLKLRPDGDALRGALFDLRGVHLVPSGKSPAAFGRESIGNKP